MAEMRRNVAYFARVKSIVYKYFLEKTLETGRKTATAPRLRVWASRFAQAVPGLPLATPVIF